MLIEQPQITDSQGQFAPILHPSMKRSEIWSGAFVVPDVWIRTSVLHSSRAIICISWAAPQTRHGYEVKWA